MNIFNEVSELLEKNTILLIEKICSDVDRIEPELLRYFEVVKNE